jgi:hypothetical protein
VSEARLGKHSSEAALRRKAGQGVEQDTGRASPGGTPRYMGRQEVVALQQIGEYAVCRGAWDGCNGMGGSYGDHGVARIVRSRGERPQQRTASTAGVSGEVRGACDNGRCLANRLHDRRRPCHAVERQVGRGQRYRAWAGGRVCP